MNKSKNGQIVLHNTDVITVMGIISDLPLRYHNYSRKDLAGCWKCEVLAQTAITARLRFVDRIYEPPRGKEIQSEAPIFHVVLCQKSNDVIVNYAYKWNRLTFILACFYALVALLMFAQGIYMVSGGFSRFGNLMLLFLSVGLWTIGLLWLIRAKKHDELTIRVFCELLLKSFNDMNKRRFPKS